MKLIKEILEGKGSQVWSVAPDATVLDALKLMAEKELGALLVMADSKLVGIISERDYARKVILKGRSSTETLVKQIMAKRVIYTQLDQTVDECMAIMTDKHVRHLPVMSEGQVVGIVSVGDLVKSIIAHQQFVIEQLERFISG